MTKNMETKLTALKEAVNDLNTAISAGNNPTTKLETAKEAVKAINAQIVEERIDELRKMPADQMWPEYIDHQFCKGYALDADKDTGRYGIRLPSADNAATVRVTFAALDTAGERLSRMEQWPMMVRILCENIVLHQADSMGKQYVARNELNSKLVEARKKMGACWQPQNGTFSMNKLVEMLNETVFAIIPDDVCGPMIKADVKYIALGLLNAKKSKTDEAGQISVRNAQSMEDFIFRAIFTRRNHLAYAFQNKQEKESSATTKPADVGVLPAEYIETPEAGDVTVVIGEAPELSPVITNADGSAPTVREEIEK